MYIVENQNIQVNKNKKGTILPPPKKMIIVSVLQKSHITCNTL